jgi:acid phosphatase
MLTELTSSPLVSFKSISDNATRLNNIQSLDAFTSDLVGESLPQWSHISPDMLNDGHNTTLSFAASWTKDFLEPLLRNEYFMNNTLVLLTYDENETYDEPNHITSLLLGGAIPEEARGMTDDTFYTHYSIISTLENNWDLPNLGRYDVGANVFQVVANHTGYQNRDFNLSGLLLNQSYPGFLNSDSKKNLTLPPPNLKLTGAGSQAILPSIKSIWAADAEMGTPYSGSGQPYDGWKTLPVYSMSSKPSKSTGPMLRRRSGALPVMMMLLMSYAMMSL